MGFLLFLLLAGLLLLSVALQRTYGQLTLKELKRRARQNDKVATGLLKAVSYGYSLRAVLWALIGVTAASFFVLISREISFIPAVLIIALMIWVSFVWLPATEVSKYGEQVAAFLAPLLAKLLLYIHPIIDRIISFIRKHRPVRIHTGLYDRLDLLELLEKQQVQAGNRIEKAELDIAKNALQFGDITVGERMTPRRKVKMVSVHDSLGPVLMDELHASGHSRFPVCDGAQDNIVGTLYLHDLVRTKKIGTVGSLMRKEAYYLHENQSLHDALQAVMKTHHHLFVVVNSFEEFVGVVSSEDVLEAIVGKAIVDEFDNYDDLRMVAARDAKKEHDDRVESHPVEPEEGLQEPEPEPEPEPEISEPEKIQPEDSDTIEFDNTK